MSKKSDQISFAAKSKYFSVYEAYKKELEKIGYEWNDEFNPFNEEISKRSTCVYVGSNWNYRGTGPKMSFSHPDYSTKVFNLDCEFESAIAFAKSEYNRYKSPCEKVVLNHQCTAEVYGDRLVMSGQTFYQPEVIALFRAAKNAGLV